MNGSERLHKHLKVAILMVVTLLLLSVQQRLIPGSHSKFEKPATEADDHLSFNISPDIASSYGILHDSTPFLRTALLFFSLLLFLFPFAKALKVVSFTPPILSRNFCCIVPKGP
ncbi:hypothetical protein ACFSRY_13015 [Pontibacter locisalis]|uniref:Uncharacterized protein n=1 Tax=Pontibacter locisalis TaxID=1719035 RepID=A0ABW5IPV1_9BACT